MSDLINELDVVHSTAALATKSYHSVLSWKMKTTTPFLPPTHEPNGDLKSSFTLYERNIPNSFLEEKIQELEEFERQIEKNLNNQSDTDNTQNLLKLLREECTTNSIQKSFQKVVGKTTEREKQKKQWWSNELSEIWNILCAKEKDMLKCSPNQRRELKDNFQP